MSHVELHNTASGETVLGVVAQIENALENRKRLIDEEVSNYPRPITACDVQFEHALDEQAHIRGELQRVKALLNENPGHEDLACAVIEFATACAFINAETEQRIKSSLAELSSKPVV